MWLCYGVHITMLHGTFVCVLCHSYIEPSLHQLDLFLEIFSWRLVSDKFLSICYVVPPINMQFVSSTHVCTDEWHPTCSQYTLPPQSSPQKGAGSKSQLCSKQSSKGPSPENFMIGYWWLFIMLHVLPRVYHIRVCNSHMGGQYGIGKR